MNTGLTLQIESTSSEDTSRIGAAIGQNLRGGELIELRGDLGSGKTTFVKGLAKGMGSIDQVRSPSFTLSHEYGSAKLTLYHFDFYRLKEAGIMSREIEEAIQDKSGVVAIEWPNLVEDILPAERTTIIFRVSDENGRKLEVSYFTERSYLFNNLTS
jgi:tRNA threonylcarbamoyladenosine biosynthesis protein TsaE